MALEADVLATADVLGLDRRSIRIDLLLPGGIPIVHGRRPVFFVEGLRSPLAWIPAVFTPERRSLPGPTWPTRHSRLQATTFALALSSAGLSPQGDVLATFAIDLNQPDHLRHAERWIRGGHSERFDAVRRGVEAIVCAHASVDDAEDMLRSVLPLKRQVTAQWLHRDLERADDDEQAELLETTLKVVFDLFGELPAQGIGTVADEARAIVAALRHASTPSGMEDVSSLQLVLRRAYRLLSFVSASHGS
ncbi:hypothetical protein [Curtobacterium sp. 20TX0008]|uniref:hypothetical protein n=1 Tax=Curtobacterium sp. 20TX0008 TaxID=3022018 RepID=UPI00232AE6B5|nr:hypothetical protein [Curtobacterium sp. 20TX0008]MDB6425958.1 hypothetical protein [Curtobacterium sp. 20TX0008]